MPQARSGQQETNRLLGYPWSSTGTCPGGIIDLVRKLVRASGQLTGNHVGRASAALFLEVSLGLSGKLPTEGLLNSLGSWLGCLQNLLGSCLWGAGQLNLLAINAPACLSAGQVQKEQEVTNHPEPEEKPSSSYSVPPAPSTARA